DHAFPAADDRYLEKLVGLVLRHGILRQQPLRQEALLRFQAVAATDIPSGSVIAPSDVRMEWSSYMSNAADSAKRIIGWRAQRAVRSGAAISTELLDPASAQAAQET